MSLFFLIIAFTLNATANILLKVSAGHELALTSVRAVLSSKALLFLGMGLVTFAANVIFYYLALRSLPLSVAYPVMVGATTLMTGGAALFLFHETITFSQMCGYAFIITGITLVFALRG